MFIAIEKATGRNDHGAAQMPVKLPCTGECEAMQNNNEEWRRAQEPTLASGIYSSTGGRANRSLPPPPLPFHLPNTE